MNRTSLTISLGWLTCAAMSAFCVACNIINVDKGSDSATAKEKLDAAKRDIKNAIASATREDVDSANSSLPSATGAPATSGAPPVASGALVRTVAPFTEVHTQSDIEADIDIGPKQSDLTLSGEESVAPKIITDVTGGVLTLSLPSGHYHTEKQLKVHMTIPHLVGVKADSKGHVFATGLASDALKVDAASGSDVTLSGKCKSLTVGVASGAKVDASGLACESAKVDAASGSDLKVNASASVKGTAASGAHVHVSGAPKEKKVDASSGASVD